MSDGCPNKPTLFYTFLLMVLIWRNYICKTQMRVRPQIVSFPQIRVLSLRHTQIHFLSKPRPLKSVSSDVTPRSMSFQKHISSDLCPLTSYTDQGDMSKEISPQICVLNILDREEKKQFFAINSRIHIWDTHWLVPVWYQLIFCIIYQFMLCGFSFFLAISDLTTVCTILCTRPRIYLWIYLYWLH
jgi:hypothetical protein